MRIRNNGEMPYYRRVPKKITKDIWYYENPKSLTVVVYIDHKCVQFNLSKSRLKKIVGRMK